MAEQVEVEDVGADRPRVLPEAAVVALLRELLQPIPVASMALPAACVFPAG